MSKLGIYLVALLLAFGSRGYSAAAQDACGELYAATQDFPHYTRADEGQLREGVQLFRSVRACYGDQEPGRVMRMYRREAAALYGLGRPQEALAVTDSLLIRLEEYPDSSMASHTYQWRGYIHYHTGNLTEAVSNYAACLSYTADTETVRKARLSADIAIIYQRMKDFGEARRYLNRGMELIEEVDAASDDILGARARLLAERSDLLLAEYFWDGSVGHEDLVEAVELVRESLEIRQELGDRYGRGDALVYLGDALSLLGNVEESLDRLTEAIRIFREEGEVTRQASATWKKGQVYLRAGIYDEAEHTLEEALQLAREAGHLDYQREILGDLGALFELQQDWSRAEDYRRLQVAVTEAYRAPLRATEWSPVAFRRWQGGHRSLVRTLLAQQRYEEAFLVLEETRARHLDDLRLQHQLAEHLEDHRRQRFDSLTTSLVDVRTALAADTTSAITAEALRLQEARLQAERRSLLDLEEEQPDVDIRALQEVLSERNQVLVSYYIGGKSGLLDLEPMSYVFVITADTIVSKPLEVSGSEIRDLLRSVSPVLGARSASRQGLNEQQFALDALHELYRYLLAPVREYLPDGAPLAIVPDDPLYGFPFGMLVEEETPRFRYKEAPFLLRGHPISVQLTARTLLQHEEERGDRRLDLLAIGQSNYGGWVPTTLAGIAGPDSLVDLPSVQAEISGIARQFGRAQVLVDTDATKRNFQEKAAEARVLHIASHTAFSSLSPFYNALLLGGRKALEHDADGVVFLHELQQWEVGAELVVLSGCDTGRGMTMGGDGMASLQYAFHSLGVPSSVATLWLVDDQAMADLMREFYRHLRRGLPKDEALQRAQLSYLERAEGPRTSPFFWASPVLYGTTSPLRLAPRPVYRASWFVYLVALALALAAGVLWHRRRRFT